MSARILQQAFEMGTMLCAGIAIGMTRRVFLFFSKQRKPSKFFGFFLEILFWVAMGVVASEFLYYCAYGELSVHSMIAMGIGFFTFHKRHSVI